MAESHPAAGAFDYGLDRILHEKARLGILTALFARTDGLRFNDLKELCALTDGNLSRHLQVLQDAGLVLVRKGYEGRRPLTVVRMSARGHRAFEIYLEELERVIRDAKSARAAADDPDVPPSWAPA